MKIVIIDVKIVEKHLTLRREDGGADSKFSMDSEEFKAIVDSISLGIITHDLTEKQKIKRIFKKFIYC